MEERRLTAIVSSDISGYTALMGESEQRALRLLKRNRRIHRRAVKKYHGQIVAEEGDGTLACFNSAMEAVRYSVRVITLSGDKNYSLHTGVHLAELIFSNQKILGEGVALAIQIGSSAKPGEILVSDVVYRNIHNLEGIQAELLGKKYFEGEKDTLGVYKLIRFNVEEKTSGNKFSVRKRVITDTLVPFLRSRVFRYVRYAMLALVFLIAYWKGVAPLIKAQPGNLEKSIAVLPFRNFGTDQESQFLANGVMESILNDLSRIAALRVTSRTSTEKYRDTDLSAKTIARQLDVNYLLEGSVQRYGDKVRIVAQLIQAREDKHIWSETYDRDFGDLLNLQSEIANSVADHLNTIVTPVEQQLIRSHPTENTDAYDLYMRGRELTNIYNSTKNEKIIIQAQNLFNQALTLDSNFALPYFGLGALYFYRYGPSSEKFLEPDFGDTIMTLCDRAIAHDPGLAEAYCLRGYFKYFLKDYQGAIDDQFRAISLSPNLSLAYLNLGVIYEGAFNDRLSALRFLKKAEIHEKNGIFLGSILDNLGDIYLSLYDTARAGYYYKKALQVLPGDYLACEGLANIAWYFKNNAAEAMTYADSLCSFYPDPYYCNASRGRIFAFRKDFTNANRCLETVREINQANHWILFTNSSFHGYVLWNLNRKAEAEKFFNDQLRFCTQDKMLYNTADYDLAGVYAFRGDANKAIHHLTIFLRKGYFGIRGTSYRILKDPLFESIRETEEFQTILKKVKEQIGQSRDEISKAEEGGKL